MTDGERWSFGPEASDDDDPRVALHERAERIRAAGSMDRSLDYALKLLFDPFADPAERRSVLMRQDLPRGVIVRATEVAEPGVRAFAIGLEATPLEVVAAAANDEAWQVRVEAARRRGCPPHVLTRLAHDPDAIVRRAALANPETPSDVLIDALTHSRSRLDAEVAGANSGFGLAPHVQRLMGVSSFGALALMKRGQVPVSLISRFTERDHSDAVRQMAIRSGHCPPEEIGRAAQSDPSADVRAAAAEQHECPPDALLVAARDANPKVRRRVAENSSAPTEAVDLLLADEDESVRIRAAKNSASPAALAVAARGDEVLRVRLAAVRNDACPVDVLDDLCADPDLVRVAALRDGCSPAGLFSALVTIRGMRRRPPARSADTDPVARRCAEVRAVASAARKRLAPRAWAWLAAQRLQDIHPDDLQRLLTRHLAAAAVDSRPKVRMAVARHPDVDDATLAVLSSDDDARVRAAVSDRILDVALGATRR